MSELLAGAKVALTPYAFVGVERLRAHLKRLSGGSEADVEDRCAKAINAATAWLELRTNRRLRGRNHRTTVTVTDCILSDGNAGVLTAGGSFSTGLAGDPVVGVGVAPGALVEEIVDASNMTMTVVAAGVSDEHVTLTLGSQPLYAFGYGDSVVYAPERPLTTLWSAYARDTDGSWVALDITGAIIEETTGRIELPNDSFEKGISNIRIECRAGYEMPGTSRRGHPEWDALERLTLRLAEIFYDDDLKLRGRTTDQSIGATSSRVPDFAMPADIERAVRPFVRRW